MDGADTVFVGGQVLLDGTSRRGGIAVRDGRIALVGSDDDVREMAERYDVIGEVRGRGAMVAIELVRPGTHEPDAAVTGAVAKACHAEGLIVLTCGTYGNVLRFLPPLVMPDHLLEEGLTILDKAFAATA